MANRTSIYRKEIMKRGLEGNVHNFMRVYYPEYYKLSQEDQREMRKLFYGDKVNSIYTRVLVDAINEVNQDEDLLNTRVFDVKLNPTTRVNKVQGEHQEYFPHQSYRYSEETKNKQKKWFKEQYPRFIDRLVEEYKIENIKNIDNVPLKILMEDFKMTFGQAEKVVKNYYISELTIDMLNKYIETGEKDTLFIEMKNQGKPKTKQVATMQSRRKKTKEQNFCVEHNDDIFRAIKNKYPNAKIFIEKENMPFTLSAFHQSRSNKRYSYPMAMALVEWYEANKPVEEKVDVQDVQLEIEIPEVEAKEEVVRATTLKPIVNASKTGIFGRKVVDEYKLSIVVKSLLNRLKNAEIEDIKFVQEFEEVEQELNGNTFASFIRNTGEYKDKQKRYDSISQDLKELAKVMEF